MGAAGPLRRFSAGPFAAHSVPHLANRRARRIPARAARVVLIRELSPLGSRTLRVCSRCMAHLRPRTCRASRRRGTFGEGLRRARRGLRASREVGPWPHHASPLLPLSDCGSCPRTPPAALGPPFGEAPAARRARHRPLRRATRRQVHRQPRTGRRAPLPLGGWPSASSSERG